MTITFISDTHNKHKKITEDLPGGDLIIHAGDISSQGYKHEIQQFCKWFSKLEGYTTKVFIAGNHDWGFQKDPQMAREVVQFYENINYLEDSTLVYNGVKIWGSPWQPEFLSWAFNLPKNGQELQEKWDLIPQVTDILITHGPAFGYLDRVIGDYKNLGCQLLLNKIKEIKPKIHICGHIHTGRGYFFDGTTHFINASVLDEAYQYCQKPLTVKWSKETNSLDFI